MSTFEAFWKAIAVFIIPMIIIIPIFNFIGLHAIGVVLCVTAIWIGCMALGDEDRKR